MKKFVVLEHLQGPNRGLRFWSLNGPKPEELSTGEVVYKKILETDSETEALEETKKCNLGALLR